MQYDRRVIEDSKKHLENKLTLICDEVCQEAKRIANKLSFTFKLFMIALLLVMWLIVKTQ